ncbi:MAG: hypothetical protein AAGB22_07600, partial [Bacteroidota bacterium]
MRIKEDAADWYADAYIEEALENGCIQSLQDFVNLELGQIDFSGCDVDLCDHECLLTLGVEAEWLAANQGQNASDYANALASCRDACNSAVTNDCDLAKQSMIADFYPGGQYAMYYDDANDQIDPTQFPLSIFNTTNSLPTTPLWSNPPSPYLDANGNPAQVLDITGNLVDPKDLPLEEFIAKFEASWASAFLSVHPEYCYLSFCQNNQSSYDYQATLLNTSAYDDACTHGLLDPVSGITAPPCASTAAQEDPFFNSAPGNAHLGAMQGYINAWPTNTSFSLYDIAQAMVHCPTIDLSDNTAVNNCLSGLLAFGGDPCSKDDEWLMFRTLYLAERMKYVDLEQNNAAIAGGCYNGCIGESTFDATLYSFNCYPLSQSPACASIPANYDGSADPNQVCNLTDAGLYADKFRRFATVEHLNGISVTTLNGMSPTAITTLVQGNQAGQCGTLCEGTLTSWMDQLAGCAPNIAQWQPGFQPFDDIRAGLKAFCEADCNPGTTLPLTVACTTPGCTSSFVYNTREDVLTTQLGTGYEESTCTTLLLGPSLQTPSTAADNPIMDECACDLIFQVQEDFDAMSLAGTLPVGVTTAAELFQHTHGTYLTDFNGKHCQCSGANPDWTAAATNWSAADLTHLANLEEPMPE